jgi:hypothetical protein
MAGVRLDATEETLYKEVEENLNMLREDIRDGQNLSYEERNEIYHKMKTAAHKLHLSLTKRGHEPIHHKYMIKNRGMESANPEFYDHIHPVEDLLAFIEDVNANKDPEDQTIGKQFDFNVYTRRWGHEDRYYITRTEDGWDIEHQTYNGSCDKTGSPLLFDAMRHDSVNYPESLGEYLEWLWYRAKEDGLSSDEVQESLNQLSSWVSLTEKYSPRGIFQGYK